jgi:RNA polymerase sigma-70 factor (ECF subfamily)
LPEVEQDSTERILIEACSRGDSGALGEIVRIYGGSLLGYLRKMCGSREQAEDLFQETFTKLYENANTIRGETLRPWLFTVATRLAINHLRRKKRVKFVSFSGTEDCDGPEAVVADQTNDPVDEAAKDERKQQVRGAIASLPEKMRATLIMAYYQGMSYAQIAECMGCSVGTVKTQMFRAMKTLAERLPEAE